MCFYPGTRKSVSHRTAGPFEQLTVLVDDTPVVPPRIGRSQEAVSACPDGSSRTAYPPHRSIKTGQSRAPSLPRGGEISPYPGHRSSSIANSRIRDVASTHPGMKDSAAERLDQMAAGRLPPSFETPASYCFELAVIRRQGPVAVEG